MTTVVNYETGEITERLDREGAERLSNRIVLRLDTIADNYEAVVPMIRESVEREAWSALGYRSPGEYAADRFGGALSRLGVEFRQAVTRELAEMGMSTRAIAGVVGVSKDTVHRDLGGVSRETPGPTTGIDGKTYSRPEPRPQTSAEPVSVEPFRPAESVEPELADLNDAGPNVQPEAGSQPPTPSPRDEAEGNLTAFLASNSTVAAAQYGKAVLLVLKQAQALGGYDAERFAADADQYDAMVVDNVAETVARFHRDFHSYRTPSGLRLLKGGSE